MSSFSPIKLGVIGLGNIARLEFEAFKNSSFIDIVAICDRDREKVKRYAEAYSVPNVYSDEDEFFSDDEMEAVEILTPTPMHLNHVLKAIERGLHISCQKPVTNTVKEALKIKQALKNKNLKFRVNEFIIFYEPVIKAKELIDSGTIGTPQVIKVQTVIGHTKSKYQSEIDINGFRWRFSNESPGGHLFDDMIHKFALLDWLSNSKITKVTAVVKKGPFFFETPSAGIFEYENDNIIGLFDVSQTPELLIDSEYYGADEFVEVRGTKGIIWVTKISGNVFKLSPLILIDSEGIKHEFNDINASYLQGFINSAEHFAKSIREDFSPELSLESATRALRSCFACYKSSAEGRKTPIDAIEDKFSPSWWPLFSID